MLTFGLGRGVRAGVTQGPRLLVARAHERNKSALAAALDTTIKQDTPHLHEGVDQTALRETQAPNRRETWAPSQRTRENAMVGVRFAGKDLEAQPRPYAAIDLIAATPVRYVSHMAVCDGNAEGHRGGVQGHPKIYINVDKPGVHSCLYCGNRYADVQHKGRIEAGELGPVTTP